MQSLASTASDGSSEIMNQGTEIPDAIDVSLDVCDPDVLTETQVEVCRAIQATKADVLPNPELECPEDFAQGWCRHIATEVYTMLGEPSEVSIVRGGTMRGHHLWIECDGRHFDAEQPCGVESYKELPYVNRFGPLLDDPTDKTESVMSCIRNSV